MTRIFRRNVYERISIKTFELQDSEPLFGRIEECRPHLRRWLPWVDSVQSAADTKVFIERGLEQAAREDGFHAAMLEDGTILGAIGLHHIDRMHRNASICSLVSMAASSAARPAAIRLAAIRPTDTGASSRTTATINELGR